MKHIKLFEEFQQEESWDDKHSTESWIIETDKKDGSMLIHSEDPESAEEYAQSVADHYCKLGDDKLKIKYCKKIAKWNGEKNYDTSHGRYLITFID